MIKKGKGWILDNGKDFFGKLHTKIILSLRFFLFFLQQPLGAFWATEDETEEALTKARKKKNQRAGTRQIFILAWYISTKMEMKGEVIVRMQVARFLLGNSKSYDDDTIFVT